MNDTGGIQVTLGWLSLDRALGKTTQTNGTRGRTQGAKGNFHTEAAASATVGAGMC